VNLPDSAVRDTPAGGSSVGGTLTSGPLTAAAPAREGAFASPAFVLFHKLRPLVIVGGFLLLSSALYWCRALLIPFALAGLITFLLSPLVGWLERRGIKGALSIAAVVLLTSSALAGAVWLMSSEVAELGKDLPRYSQALRDKIAQLRRVERGSVREGFQAAIQAVIDGAQAPGSAAAPTPLLVQEARPPLVAHLPALLEPLVAAGFVVMLVGFMLYERQELRDRLIRIFGYGRLSVTTKALDEASRLIARYLFMQTLINAGEGVLFAVSLRLIGVPYAALWGVLLAVLRFIPYVGVWVAVSMPLLLSLALFAGWQQIVEVLGVFLALELSIAMVLEPVVYSHGIGVSKIALLVALAYWTWLWGPIGLLLGTPMTVCLVVLSKYVSELQIVATMLGDAPALGSAARYYQRLLVGDHDEAAAIVDAHLASHTRNSVYDEVLLPALSYAKRDRASGSLSSEDAAFVIQTTREIVDDLEPAPPSVSRSATQGPILGCPARDASDELALEMLRQLLDAEAIALDVVSRQALASEVLSRVEQQHLPIVCISAGPPGGLAQARYLCKRLRARVPGVKIVVGRWGEELAPDRLEALLAASADHVSVTLLDARDSITRLVSTPVANQAAATPRVA
jgi:predicted PurR-regulated permease PerM